MKGFSQCLLTFGRFSGLAVALGFLAAITEGCVSEGNSRHEPVALKLSRTIPLPGVTNTRTNVGVPGRFDHFAYDPVTRRLFVAALENNSLEVLDLAAGQRLRSIPGILHAQGLACITNTSSVAITSGEDGLLHIFDTQTLEQKQTIEVGPDADNVRYDAGNNTILVSYGTTNGGAIAAFNAQTWAKLRDIHFSSRPESFQIDPNSKWLFANLPKGVRAITDGEVAIADRETGEIVAIIPLPGLARNFPMAYDAAHGRLFIASRRPARLIEIDVRKRLLVAETPCTDDADDLFFDPQTSQVLVIGGGFRPDLQTPESRSPVSPPGERGGINVFGVSSAGKLTLKTTVPTAPHARTGFFIQQRRALYLAVPMREGQEPEVREYVLP